jgi:hypothetical protein
MTPYQKARQVYETEECARTFEEDLVAHFDHGHVISTPELFLMFRPVDSIGRQEEITDSQISFRNTDTWHVYLAAGDASQFSSHFPYPLPFVSFERKNVLRFYRFRQFSSRLTRWTSKDPTFHLTS